MPITPDTKSWTWVLSQPCPECGFDVATTPPDAVADRLRAAVPVWTGVLLTTGAAERPDPSTWSPLEYGAHVRDVCLLFWQRLGWTLQQDDPEFEDWDQDATALEKHYAGQDPRRVAVELEAAAGLMATYLDTIQPSQWPRTSRRGDGSVFTTATLAQYFLHDVEHHVWDVTRDRGA